MRTRPQAVGHVETIIEVLRFKSAAAIVRIRDVDSETVSLPLAAEVSC